MAASRGSSVHFKPLRNPVLSEVHDRRVLNPKYLLSEEHRLPNIAVIDGDVVAVYEEKMALASGRARATDGYSPLKWGVVNLPDESTERLAEMMDDWCTEYRRITGEQVVACVVHRDEGRLGADGSVHRNVHAHVVTDRTDERGRTRRMDRPTMSRMGREVQDMTALVTGLTRGEDSRSSGRRHIDHHAYRALARQGRILSAAEREQVAQQGAHVRQQSERAEAAEKAAGEARRDAENARYDSGLHRRAAERLDGGREDAAAAHPERVTPEDIARARAALETHSRQHGLDYAAGYKSLRNEWVRENDRELRVGHARPHSQKDYSSLRLAHLEIEAERRGARREHAKRERSTRRGRRQTHRARQERDRAREQQAGARSSTGGGRQDRTEYQRLRDTMGLFSGTSARATQADYQAAKKHAGDAAWCAAQRELWEHKAQQIGTTIEALRAAAAAREKERRRRQREREIRDLLDQVVRQGTLNGIAGVPLPERPPWRIGDFRREWDQARRRVVYRDAAGGEAFHVTRHLITGPGLQRDDALRAALVVGAARFGGQVQLTGSAEFRRRAAQQARALGICVSNPIGGTAIGGTERGKRRGIDEGR